MIIDGKLYRIKEDIYADGHKEYTAQRGYKILFFTIWRNFVISSIDYGYGSVNLICCGTTYKDCLEHLKESLTGFWQNIHKDLVKSSYLFFSSIFK